MEKELEDLKAIREMMEKSSKVLSLSGLSGVMAGTTAIIGAAFAYFYVMGNSTLDNMRILLLLDALVVLLISIGFGIFFSWKKARKKSQKLLNNITLRTIYHLAIPLATGGIVSLIFLFRGYGEMVASTTLIFYGLALVNASKYTCDEIHYLGITEIVLGICAALFLYHGLSFWTLGFGICHIVYGLIMYKKYDLK